MNNEKPTSLEFRLLTPSWELSLIEFFNWINNSDVKTYFHPHPFTQEQAYQLAHYQGKDLYYIVLEKTRILGYGMLRGWDEGYNVPSVGICLHSSVQGIGLGVLFMNFLHIVAKRRGVSQMRLKVYSENLKALNLYRKLGYTFKERENEQLVGYLNL